MSHETRKYALAGIVILAVALRIIFLVQFSHTPFYGHPILDSRIYMEAGENIAAGNLVGDSAFFMGPLYSYVLGFLYFLSGGVSPLLPRLVQMLFGLVTCFLIYQCSREIFNEASGIAAALIYAAYRPVLFYEQTLLMETSLGMICVLILFLTLLADKKGTRTIGFLCGLAIGIAALFRGNALVFLPVVIGWLILRKSDDRWIRIDQKKAMQIVFIILGTIAAILPATVHNYAAERQFIPISSNAGVNLYIGNNPQSSPFYEVPPDINMSGDMMGKAAATRAAGKELGSSEISGYWKNRALTWIRSDPFHFLKLFASRIYHFWGWGEPEQVYSMKEMSGLIPGLKWPLFHYGVLSPLALTGVILGLIRARRRKILPSLFIFSWMFSLAPFFITARYRIPIIPVMSIPAGFVCITVYQQIRGKKFKRAGIIFGTIVIFFFLLNNTRYLDNRQSGEAFHNSLGLIYKEKGDIDKALEEFRKAAEIGKAPQIYANMGDCLYLKRTFSEALEYYRKSEKSSPDNPMIYFKMGQCYLEMNNQKKAFGMFRKAVRIDPEVHPLAWYNLTFLYMTGGNPEKAAECFKVYRRMRPEDLEAVQTYRRFMEKFSK